ncbi:ROK family protein [Terriglobus saanensis]|uniref:ROK family protein n=1 Tax=Terriglobus saanensis (strain ATCC BAA-1853 / DSM 23119 / SP1PR4) TaxID=401053 RepID=E8V003_TERSS|nr:ROK family protein [Terriglobus saanensis]ADV82158.1 ROK family protein [Terriglobus saanensis SP1PR4]
MAKIRIGIDLGGTKIEGRAFDAEGHELDRLRVPTPREDYDGTLAAIGEVATALETRTGSKGLVGLGIPGTIVRSTGLVKNANSTWLNGRPLELDLKKVTGRDIRCANDANCLAISEATDGAAAGYGVVFGVILGTGCGGGVSLEGKVHAGPNGLAGEWGHNPLPRPTPAESPGPLCYCGHTNCMELWLSGSGLERDYAQVTGKSLRGPEIVAASEAGDVEAEATMQRWEDRVARGFTTIINMLDPDAIVIGGGLSNLDRLYTNVPPRVQTLIFGGGALDTPILKAVHGDASGVRGAAWLWPASALV